MIRRGIITAAALLLAATPAAAKIRALFVGVDTYQWSRTHAPENDFSDLRGAVADLGNLKKAMVAAYHLDLDVPGQDCASSNAVSITLTNGCAKRAAVLAAFGKQIDSSAPGDTVVFYYAGHGSQFVDDMVRDQASGHNDTIMPADAREPGAADSTDILDRELRQIIDRANAAGVNVVTIFDSCNSGTATRGAIEGEARKAPPLKRHIARPPLALPPAQVAPQSGYRVHLAAAADGEVAKEVGSNGLRNGVFTSALAEVLLKMPNATFDDIANEVRLRVEATGSAAQHPQAEGELRARMGGDARDVRLVAATPDGAQVRLLAGRLSDVTAGSTFAVFGGSSAAQDAAAVPLASGTVTRVEANAAWLTLGSPPAAPLPNRLSARETARGVPGEPLRVRIGTADAAARGLIAQAMQGLAFAKVSEPAQLLVSIDPPSVDAMLTTADGTPVARLGPVRAPLFARNLHDAIQKVARVQSLLALRTDPAQAGLAFCLDTSDYDTGGDLVSCPPLPAAARGRIKAPGERRLPVCATPLDPLQCTAAKLTVVNTVSTPRYVYVLGIDDAYGITALLPSGGGRDPPLPQHRPYTTTDIRPDSVGRYRFVTIASKEWFDVSLFEQQGNPRSGSGCLSALQKALCDAHRGRRDAGASNAGDWTAIVTSAVIVREAKP